jgi:DtxR family Mn-dependent transcriptional regulator
MPKLSTIAEQDYLKAIYQLGGATSDVATSDLAERLALTAGSVSAMLRKLDEQGFVSHERYRGVRLTERGAREAVEMIRHHRLLELYLSKVVGMPWDKVHAEADALEHVISEDLESRLDELLGFPTHDPHGHPIPSAALDLVEDDLPALSETAAGMRGVVRRVSDRNADLLRHLAEIGLAPGVRFTVIEVIPFSGGVRVRIKGTERVIGLEAAHAVGVELL